MSKKLSFGLDGTTSTYASFSYALPYYVVLLAAQVLLGEETLTLSRTFLVLVLLRSVTDTFAEGMKMHAFTHGDISVVSMVFSISPVFLLVTSPLITGDMPSPLGAAAVLLVVAGSLAMVYRPAVAHGTGQQRGILLALGASFFFSLNSCFDRLAVKEGRPVLAGFSMTLLSALFLFPLVVRRKDRLEALRSHRLGLLARGLLEIAFMVCKLYALQFAQAPYVVGVMRLSLLFSIIGGRVFFGEPDFPRRLAAGALILAGASLIAYLEW
ncbi:MAG TPA: DMT family transporter [Gemmataceae bacterium]|nr:DMT family transporter [Gemmataceae bacterium]